MQTGFGFNIILFIYVMSFSFKVQQKEDLETISVYNLYLSNLVRKMGKLNDILVA